MSEKEKNPIVRTLTRPLAIVAVMAFVTLVVTLFEGVAVGLEMMQISFIAFGGLWLLEKGIAWREGGDRHV
ncbi:hypothetical protein [Natronorubrum halophilum]|uniref:hypothetical protein n=1 Tax=Natronorubrum halophilum TaxID=1702106 RepID=UPI0013CF3010|nr:hypothetical protein [Natronorubrum halophilum]